MIIDKKLIDSLILKAQNDSRLRTAYDLRNSTDDSSQRILNVLLPGTQVPIHRHLHSSETTIIIHGRLTIVYYDEKGQEKERIDLSAQDNITAVQIEKGRWHGVLVTEPCALIEVKDGPYKPFEMNELMNK